MKRKYYVEWDGPDGTPVRSDPYEDLGKVMEAFNLAVSTPGHKSPRIVADGFPVNKLVTVRPVREIDK